MPLHLAVHALMQQRSLFFVPEHIENRRAELVCLCLPACLIGGFAQQPGAVGQHGQALPEQHLLNA